MEGYIFRRGRDQADGPRLKELFEEAFQADDVGALAQSIFDHLPGMARRNWFIAEEEGTGTMVAAFALIPWQLELEGVGLKVAEMGIVGTLQAHRGRGLMRALNRVFDQALDEEGFDLAIIQGIPGFYGQFGYQYALPLENHINLQLYDVADAGQGEKWDFRLASLEDIPFLLDQDRHYKKAFALATHRDEAHWRYLLTEGSRGEDGSEFWLMETGAGAAQFYLRLNRQGFGKGLIVSEVSEGIGRQGMEALLRFCKGKALERDKPYLRLNLHGDSAAGKLAVGFGAAEGRPYAWQVKFADRARYLRKIKPVLEARLASSPLAGYSGRLRLNFFRDHLDLVWRGGQLAAVERGDAAADDCFNLNGAHFAALCLGHRSWREIRHISPDIFPASPASALLLEALLPPRASWLYQQY